MWIAALVVLAAGYWGRWSWALALAAVVAVAHAVMQPSAGWPLLGLQSAVWLALPAVPWSLKRSEEVERSAVATQQQDVQAGVVELRSRLTALQRDADTLTDDISRLIELYRVTKEVAGEVRVAGLFEGLTTLFSSMLTFHGWYLVLTAVDAGGGRLIMQSGWKGGGRENAVTPLESPAAAPWIEPLLAEVHAQPAPRWLPRGSQASPLARETDVAWIPLVSQQRLRGVMVFEGLPSAEFDRAQIIAHQVALQLERVLLYEELERLAVSDSLTELPLRRFFLQRLQDELARAQRHQSHGALVMIDIDHFKQLNDTHGHLVGDEVLRRLGALLKANVREIDLTARYGGEEFALYLVDTAEASARLVAERIRRTIEECTIQAYDEALRMTVSIGLAFFPVHGTAPADLLEHADQALYQAKAGGRNSVAVYGGGEQA